MASVLSVARAGPQTAAEESLQAMTARLREEGPRALPDARLLFEALCDRETDTPALKAFGDRLAALDALRDRIGAQLKAASRREVSRSVLALVERTPAASSAPLTTTRPAKVSAEQLYKAYARYFYYPIDTGSLSSPEKRFLQAYYHAHVQAMVDELMFLGRPLEAVSRDNYDLGYYLLLLPLLHSPSGFDPTLLDHLPPWLLTSASLERLSDFCLFKVGRLDAAEAVALRLQATQPDAATRRDFFVRTASRCRKAGRPKLAVKCLRRAIALCRPDDPAVVAYRFEIYHTWHEAENLALAADEAGAIARDYPGTEHAGKARFLRISCLVGLGEDRAALTELEPAIDDPTCRPFRADLLYLKWKCLRKEGRAGDVGRVLRSFLSEYPQNPHGAEMFFAVGVDCLSVQRYEDALNVFEAIVERYPGTSWSKKAKGLVKKIRGLGIGEGESRP